MSNLFIPTQGPAAEAYNDLVRYYGAEDYHAHYIRTFQVILSSLLKEDFLVNDPDYKDAVPMYPLPPSNAPNQYLPQEGFLSCARTTSSADSTPRRPSLTSPTAAPWTR